MKLEDCFKKRLLRRDRPDAEKAKKSLELAEKRLELSKQFLKDGIYDASLLYGYMSMFHAARAILFKDGVVEKSHACMITYLREKYVNVVPIGIINAMDAYRLERHEIMYGLDFRISKEDCECVVEDAQKLIEIVRKLISTQHQR